MLVKTLGLEGGWIVRSYIDWGGERNILYKVVETSPKHINFKNPDRKREIENPKKTISTSGGFGLLQNVNKKTSKGTFSIATLVHIAYGG